jgi:hypothetical protein
LGGEENMAITDEIAEVRARWNRLSLYQKFEHAVIVVLTTLSIDSKKSGV